MKTVANILWLVFIGWWYALALFIEGLLCCITIIFIPIGFQYFKLAKLVFCPFGKTVSWTNSGVKTLINVLWLIFFGWENALLALFIGSVCCITIIGIPIGLQMFKISKLLALPLGAKVS